MAVQENLIIRKWAIGTVVIILDLLLCGIAPCFGGNILLVTTNSVASPSHYMALSTITGGLVANGHNVTIVTNDVKGLTGFPNGTFSQALAVKASYLKEDIDQLELQLKNTAVSVTGLLQSFYLFNHFLNAMYSSCLDLWNDRNALVQLKNSHFDFALVFPFSSCDVLMAHYINVPFAVIFPSIRAPTFHEGFIGMPLPSSYVPFDIFSCLTDEMTFLDRLKNLASFFVYGVIQYVSSRPYHHIQVEHHISPEKSIKELYSHASLYLAHVSMGSDFARPFTPNFIPIGGLVSRPSKPLTKELSDFVDGSGDHGVVIFSLGSAIQGLSNKETIDIFARVFRKLPQRVLWKHNTEPPASIGSNTRLVKWLPQNDLLGHPKTRLLIYHGGSNGVLESIYHGVPMVIIPIFADQFAHAARVQKKGMGLILHKTNITEESLTAVIHQVLTNPSYKKRAKLFSDIHHDMPMTPLQRAVYWIEHVMKFGGAHLRPRSADMNFVELYMIDVTIFIIVVCVIGIYIVFVSFRKCYRICCTSKQQKSKYE